MSFYSGARLHMRDCQVLASGEDGVSACGWTSTKAPAGTRAAPLCSSPLHLCSTGATVRNSWPTDDSASEALLCVCVCACVCILKPCCVCLRMCVCVSLSLSLCTEWKGGAGRN